MKVPKKVIEIKAISPINHAFEKLELSKEASSLCIIDQTEIFSLCDETKIRYTDTIKVNKSHIFIRFQPQKVGKYTIHLKGFDEDFNEVLHYEIIGEYSKKKSNIVKIGLLGATFLFGFIFIFGFKNYKFYNQRILVKDLIIHPHDTLYIGSTEKYSDTDMLQNRFQRYYDVNIDCTIYANRSLNELYELLNEGKISCMVTPLTEVDTSSMVWSEAYAIDDVGENGLRLGISKTVSNIELIRRFNEE